MQSSFLIQTVVCKGSEPESVLRVCMSLVEILENLVSIDADFSIVEISPAIEKGFSYEIKENFTDEEKLLLAETMARHIIDYDRDDIAKNDKEPNPSIDFKRTIGFNKSLIFQKQKGTLSGNFGLGNAQTTVFNIKFINKDSEKHFDFVWFENVIKCMIDFFDPNYSTLVFSSMKYHEMKSELKLSKLAGWITYFKDGADIVVPDCMNGATVERYGNGKLVILSRDESTYHNSSAAEKRSAVFNVMKQLKQK